jgi:DNA polymerase (family 10)
MSWMAPELRENIGEIEAAMENRLPKLVKLADVRGDLHVHSDWSDGNASIEEMAMKAKDLGLKYIAICDHSKSLRIARGRDEARLRKQMAEIDRMNNFLEDFTVLKGVECEIMADGRLDYRDSILRDLDIVVASVHSGFRTSRKNMTDRMVSAIHNDHVSIIGHPTGRLIERRQPYEIDLEKVFDAAAVQNVMMEINALPNRLDLNDINSRKAKNQGVLISIGSDAHSRSELDFLELGVSVARRGWLEAKNVSNTFSIKELMEILG